MPQKYMIDATTLSAIADKIRSKLGDNNTMTPLQIPSKIDSIDSARYTAGYNAGDTAGYNRGYTAGESSGYSTGYSAGRSSGLAEGVDSLSHFSTGSYTATGPQNISPYSMGVLFSSDGTAGIYYIFSYLIRTTSSGAVTVLDHTLYAPSDNNSSRYINVISTSYSNKMCVTKLEYTPYVSGYVFEIGPRATTNQTNTNAKYTFAAAVIGPGSVKNVGQT